MKRSEYETWVIDRNYCAVMEDRVENAILAWLTDRGVIKVPTEMTMDYYPDHVLVAIDGQPTAIRIPVDEILPKEKPDHDG